MIKVIVTLRDLIDADYRISAETVICTKLRAAGIPVIGSLAVRGVSEGTLYCDKDEDGSLSFTWVEC